MTEPPETNQPGGGEEKRATGEEGKRFAVNWDLSAGHRKAGTIRGHVINVSCSGVLIRVPEPYEVGNIIEVEMSPEVGVLIRSILQIMRLHARTTASYDYGAIIVRHTAESKAQLLEAVLTLRRQETASDFGRYPRSRGRAPEGGA